MIIEMIKQSAYTIAQATNGNPGLGMLVVFLFYIALVQVEALVEKLLWGQRFEHWLDVVFMFITLAYCSVVVWACAVYQINSQ